MSKRWKPNNSYYFIDAAGSVSNQNWNNDCIDEAYYEFGNCFETKEQAEAVAAKAKELFLSISGEARTSSSRWPKLTAEVFSLPDCPKWAKWAAVDENGEGFYYENKPECYGESGNWFRSGKRALIIKGEYDESDWQNSLIERPKKSFPKLTAEVFDYPDCPEWAKWAAVDQSGYAYWFEAEPVEGELQTDRTGAWGSHDNKKIITGLWDSSDWLNSLIERPEKSYPRLTEEVFDRPDCPRWAQYAAVDEDGTVALFEQRPTIALVGKWWDREGKYCPLDGRYDNLNWRNSLIERPAKLPAWCKVDAMGWHKRCGYFKVTYIDDVSKRVDIQQVGEKSRGYFSFHTICNETVQANNRPYNEEEMQKLVGKVLELDGNRDLVTSYDEDSESVYADAMWMNSDELLSNGYTIDGEPCCVLEHLENGEWVK